MPIRERDQRHEEIRAIRDRKAGVREVRDEANRYTVVGAADRETFANWLTPIEDHFVCHRNPMPDGDADSWTVSLTGLDGADALSLATIREEFPTVAVAHTMECAGNGRGQHDPETGSVQWDAGAVATAIWTGTPVRSVLRRYGVDAPEGRWLTAVGADSTEDEAFARSIPLAKALEDCILADGMNGQPLPPEHGHPVRLVVPGWYGVNNVKWVDELRVDDSMVTEGSLDRPGTHAHWQQATYRIHPPGAEPAELATVEDPDTEAQLAADDVEHPYTFDETVMSLVGTPTGTVEAPGAGDAIEVRGVAWAGDDAVEGVAVSTDGGESWTEAELFGPDYAGTWRLFGYEWDAEPGTHQLVSRATDEYGRSQPASISDPEGWDRAVEAAEEFPWNEGGYAANAYLPNAVTVTVME